MIGRNEFMRKQKEEIKLSKNYNSRDWNHRNKLQTHQRVVVIAHKHERIDGRGVICNANSIHRPVLWIVIVHHRRDGIGEKVKAVYKRCSNKLSFGIAIWEAAD